MLSALGLLLLALLLLGVPAALPGAGRPWVGRLVLGGSLLACIGFAAIAILVLGGAAPAPLPLPFGPPWGGLSLALDGLGAWFLLILGLVGGLASLAALGAPPGPPRTLLPYPLFLAGMALTLAAGDLFTLLLGFEAMSFASWVLVAAAHEQAENRRAARLYLGFAVFAGACLAAAAGLFAAGAGGLDFATLRAAPPEGWRATAILALLLAGAGAKAGMVPLHAWLPLAHPAAPSHVSALMSGAMTKVALYVLARGLFDLCGPAQPAAWGVPLLLLGVAGAVLGGLRANLEDDTKTLLACSTIENIGLILAAFGLALAFRGRDLGGLAALAAGAALLHALHHGVFKALLFLAAGAVLHAAGSRRIDRLGGLIHAMPATAACAMLGAGAAAALPPLSGFASEWLLLQALLAAWKLGDIALQVLAAAALALAGMAVALAAAAMVRFIGLVFLGRPRTPRGAGAQEAAPLERAALAAAAALTLGFGLLPGALLDLAGPAILSLAGTAPAREGLGLLAGEGAAAYLPLLVALLLGAVLLATWWLVRRRSPQPVQRGPVWNCGFIDPPHVFGDPLTQPSAAGIAQPLRRMLGTSLLAATERVDMPRPGEMRAGHYAAGFRDPSEPLLLAPLGRGTAALAAQAERLRDFSLRQCLGLGFAALVGLLILIAWLEAA